MRRKKRSNVQAEAGLPEVDASSGGASSSFTPGTTAWVRVRTCGLKGVMGAWSDPAKIMVV